MSIEDVWMITCWSDEMLEKKGITVDCNGPDGNAYGLLALAENLCLLYTSPSPRH